MYEPDIGDSSKGKIRAAVRQHIEERCPERKVAVLLSGGADSTVVALAAHSLGKSIAAFTFEIEGYPNADCQQARRTASSMGWDFNAVRIGLSNLPTEFLDLFYVYGCRLKTEAEVLLPMVPVLKAVKSAGYDAVLTGFGSPLPDGRQSIIECHRDAAAYWKRRRDGVGKDESAATAKVREFASSLSLELICPLDQHRIVDALYGKEVKEFTKGPYPKHHWKDGYRTEFERLGLLNAPSLNLQIGGSVEQVFHQLTSVAGFCHPGSTRTSRRGDVRRLCSFWYRRVRDGFARPSVT